MSDQTIRVQDLSYNYGDLQAVDQISFGVEAGHIFGFLGPNGAGKSTTVNMLTGQLRPKSGSATVLGFDISRKAKAVQAQIGVGFEISNHYEQLSAIENLKLFARLFDVKNFDPVALLGRVGLADRGTDAVEKYSKGMKQRLMVARALVNTPKILFLDEPTEGLDPSSSQTIQNVIREERDRGATVFLTTHDMHEADSLSDHVAFINQGKIVALDTPHNLKQQFGTRAIKAQVRNTDGELVEREVILDQEGTADSVKQLFDHEDVITLHSEEATLEDIFIQITGRGLSG
jgi:ABC-2 type transport system ATP-binding protein